MSVVLLKGADTLVAAPREGVLVAAYGRPSLATAGKRRRPLGLRRRVPREGDGAAPRGGAGAVAHGVASRLVSPQPGLVASDLLPGIQRALEGEGADI